MNPRLPGAGRPRRHARTRLERAFWVAALALAACRSDRDRQHQAHLLVLADHIDRLRSADNADKRAHLDRLAAFECQGPEACALKDLCVRAYDVHQRALDAVRALGSASTREPNAAVSELQARFERAQKDLDDAKTLTETCADEQVRAVRKTLM